jgi:hypothetical protein
VADGVQVDNAGLTDYDVHTDERSIGGATKHVQRVGEIGNTALANGQVNISSTAATIAAARETRKSLLIINQQTVPVWIGVATVTSANGVRLDPGASIVLTTTALVQGITSAAYTGSGDALVQYVETYDS